MLRIIDESFNQLCINLVFVSIEEVLNTAIDNIIFSRGIKRIKNDIYFNNNSPVIY